MTKFQALQSKFKDLKAKDQAFWDGLYSVAQILVDEFARYIQVPLKSAYATAAGADFIRVGKLVNREFVACDLSTIEKGADQVVFALALVLDQKPSVTPPNQVTVLLTVGLDGHGYKVDVGSFRNRVRVIDGDFSDLNEAIFQYFEKALEPVADIE
jgi:hypothetical protein